MNFNMFKLYILSVALIVFSCKIDNNTSNVKNDEKGSSSIEKKLIQKNLNLSFLLDLSDRINPEKYPNQSMEYYLRDVAYIKSVSNAFISHLQTKKVREMNDKIQLYFDPSPQNQNINNLSDDLRFVIDRSNVSLDKIDEISEAYAKKPLEIYELAIKDNHYVGSDTWRFFKTKVKDYCIEDNFRNVLVILTDGYIFHKDSKIQEVNKTSYLIPQLIRRFKLNDKDWQKKMEKQGYGFLPVVNDLSDLEILVLGIKPDNKNPYEEDIIMKYWKDWFNSMKVKKYEIKTSALPSNLDKIINEFINN